MENFVDNKEQLTRTQNAAVLNPDEEKGELTNVSDSGIGSGNGVAVNAAGAKVTIGVGELNNSKGNGAQISNVQGDVNFGNVSLAKPSRFDNLPPAPDIKQINSEQEFGR